MTHGALCASIEPSPERRVESLSRSGWTPTDRFTNATTTVLARSFRSTIQVILCRCYSGYLRKHGGIRERESMNVRDIMSTDLLTVAPESTLREAARRMSERNVGAALLVDPAIGSYPGIITERDLLDAIAMGYDPDVRRVGESATSDIVTVSVDASLEQAAEKMTKYDFRHLLVVSGGDAVGIVSARDLVSARSHSGR